MTYHDNMSIELGSASSSGPSTLSGQSSSSAITSAASGVPSGGEARNNNMVKETYSIDRFAAQERHERPFHLGQAPADRNTSLLARVDGMLNQFQNGGPAGQRMGQRTEQRAGVSQ